MFAIEFTRALTLREGVDPADAAWTRCLQLYPVRADAEEDRDWMEQEDEQFAYRVVEVHE